MKRNIISYRLCYVLYIIFIHSHITQHSYIGKLCNVQYSNVPVQQSLSHFECYEMDVLKYKIGCGNKTKITFRLNKNSPISSSVALRVKK